MGLRHARAVQLVSAASLGIEDRRDSARDGAAEPVGCANVSEQQARQVAEEARESEWKLPSFCKELFLGALPARPDPSAAQPRRRAGGEGRRVPAQAARLPRERRRSAPDRARREDPRRGHRGTQGARRARHEGPRGVRRPRALAGLLQPRADARRRLPLCAVHVPVRAPVDRRGATADAVRQRGAEARVAAEGREGPRVGVLPDRAGRRHRPGAGRDARDPDRGRLGLRDQRAQAVGDERRDRRRRGGDGAGPEGRRAQGRNHGLHRPATTSGSSSRTATSSWGCAGSRTRSPASTTSSCRPSTGSATRAWA